MELKYILANIMIIVVLYDVFKRFNRRYSYCKTYTWGYAIGFLFVFIIPPIIIDLAFFIDMPWQILLSIFNIAALGFVIYWHGIMAYNKEKIKKEGVCPNPTLVANPKMFKTIVYSYFIMSIIATLIVLFL